MYESVKENPNPPKVTFRMIRGRVVPIVAGKRARGAGPILRQEIQDRYSEVKHADKGYRGASVDWDHGHAVNFGVKSTFPPFFSQLKFNSRKQFLEVVEKKKGKKYEDLVEDSIDGLLHGRESSHGYIPPNQQFRFATKQSFNNRGVVFRRIDGKVRPLKFKKKEEDEVPF